MHHLLPGILLLLVLLTRHSLLASTVTCHQDKMTLTLDSAQNVDKYTFIDSDDEDPAACGASSSVLVIDIPLNGCGTRKSLNDTHILFTNVVTGSQEERLLSIVNRGPLIVTIVKCLYRRDGTTNVVNWVSGEAVADEAAIAAMQYGMTIYSGYVNETLSGEYEEFPIALQNDTLLYVDISFDMSFENNATLNLFVIVTDLFFSSSILMNDTTVEQYKVVVDGCPVHDSAFSEIDRVHFSTSVSINTTDLLVNVTDLLYLHSIVTLCDEDDEEFETCVQTCDVDGDGNSKRDIDTGFAEFHLYIGEFEPVDATGSGSHVTLSLAMIGLSMLTRVF